MTKWLRGYCRAAALAASLALAACGGGSGGWDGIGGGSESGANAGTGSEGASTAEPGGKAPGSQEPKVANEVARGSLTPEAGGVIKVPDDAKGLGGARIEVPPDAALDQLDVQVGYEDGLPGPLRDEAVAAGAKPVSKTVVIEVTHGGASTFNKPVTLTIPYDTAAAGGLPPAVVYWDPDAGRYRTVAVIAVDTAKGTVTFQTSHFSKFVAVVVDALLSGIPGTDTGFRLLTDSVLHQNFGSYLYGGHCAAFSSMSTFYYSMAKPKRLFSFAQEGAAGQPVDDELTRTALAMTYALIDGKWSSFAPGIVIPSKVQTGLLMIQSMILTGDAVHLVMHAGGTKGGHSVTAFAYDAANKRFRIYDSNFPNNEATFDWSMDAGFGTYSRALAYSPDMFDNIGYASDDTFGAPAQFRRIIADWESGALKDYFQYLEVTDTQGKNQALAYGASVTVKMPYDDNQTVAGKFSKPSGSAKPGYLHVYYDGVRQSAAGVPLSASGDFSLNFPKKLDNKVEVMLLVSEHPRDMNRGFSAFGKFTVQPDGKNFFVNFGFETGDATGWKSWSTQRTNPWTPTKLEIVNVGFDPIATDIPTVVFGAHAARINDSTPNYHKTFVSQKAVVPVTGNPQLVFQWAAVLEDPQHSPEDQPYIKVVVRNVTTGVDLYAKEYFTSDPQFKGWKDYKNGTWKAIPWQSVVLTGMSAYAGNEIELVMEGADCNLGAHGGYVYLDGEE